MRRNGRTYIEGRYVFHDRYSGNGNKYNIPTAEYDQKQEPIIINSSKNIVYAGSYQSLSDRYITYRVYYSIYFAAVECNFGRMGTIDIQSSRDITFAHAGYHTAIFFWGNLSPSLSTETGAENLKVFSVASHDTASAIAAIPEEGEDWAFLSSGTWSLLGVVTDKPILTDQARLADFTNEGGANGKILFLRNITGLWLLQRLLDEWRTNEGIIYSYDYLLEECKNSPVFRSTIDCDYPSFVNPLSMIKAIQDYCRNTNQPEPETKGQFVRCIFESLAIKYRDVMDCLQQITGKKYNRLFVVGGGSQNQFLNQCIADILGIEVITGLTESTAIGNIVQQAIANNELSGWEEARQVIYNTFSLTSYLPRKE